MTRSRTFIAPGKVVILGEYAVLDGAPAIVAAVNRGVKCTVTDAPTSTIEAPDTRYVGPALGPWKHRPGRYRFESCNPTRTRTKAGLGSSAAATVAATLAGSSWNGTPLHGDELYRAAKETHHSVQGSGSGIDIAASVYGGVLQFQGGDILPLPSIPFYLIWSGQSASTGPRVEQYLSWVDRTEFVRESTVLVHRFPSDPVTTFRDAYTLLCDMAEAAKINYVTQALEEIIAISVSHGGGAKPSGAGGGDCAVVCLPPNADPTGFLADCANKGYQSIDVSLSPGAHEGAACLT